jgi:putative aldouronate transport system permease protein
MNAQHTRRAHPRWYQQPRTRRKGLIMLSLLLPGILYYVIFRYVPMWGTVIAFQNFNPFAGLLKSPWVGFKHFETFFQSIYFGRLIGNTLALSMYGILFSFPIPILFALLLNEVRFPRFRSAIQSISYFPHFISTVIICGLLKVFLSPSTGFINAIIVHMGGAPIEFLQKPQWFRFIYIASDIWQTMGWSSIIYYATLTSVDTSLYEAAEIDGANRLQKIMSISVPSLIPTITTLLLMSLGNALNVGYEKVLLLYNPATYETADVIRTYVYRTGLASMQYSFAAAVSLFNSLVGVVIVITFNTLARRLGDTSLW